jgi:hypothetical protein
VSTPFSGDADLLRIEPRHGAIGRPIGRVLQPGEDGTASLEVTLRFSDGTDNQQVQQFLEAQATALRESVVRRTDDVEAAMHEVERLVRELVQERVERVARTDSCARALNLPIRLKSDAPRFDRIPVRRRVAAAPASHPGKPEASAPGIDAETYEEILRGIRHQAQTFEQTPATYESHDEEDPRNMILASLNCFFEGAATGGTFRKRGKIDIRIEDGNRAAFVAECKVWRGEAEFLKAVDQLLGYLTWRDCKTALVVFNKANVRSRELVGQLPAMIEKHRLSSGSLREVGQGE